MSAAPEGTQSIQRVATILRVLTTNSHGLRLSEILEATGLQRPTAHRILQALIHEEMVRQDPESRRYGLGPSVYELGLAAAPRFDVRAICAPSLERLAGETGDTAFLTARAGYDSICLDRREGNYVVRALTAEVGGRRPLGTTAGSLALLCDLDDEEAEHVMTFNAPRIPRYGRLTPPLLASMVRRGRTLGYALNADDITIGLTGLGVIIPPQPNRPDLAVSVVALSSRLEEPRRSEAVALLKEEAAKIAVELDRASVRG